MVFKKVKNNCIHALRINKRFGKGHVIFLVDFKEDFTDKKSFYKSEINKFEVAEHINSKIISMKQ
jgi:hypothetical protein